MLRSTSIQLPRLIPLLSASIFYTVSPNLLADVNTELAKLLNKDPNLQVTWNETHTQPVYLNGQLSVGQYRSAQQLVDTFLQQHRSLLGLAQNSNLVVTQSQMTAAGEMLSYKQMHQGLEVVGAKLVARVSQGKLNTLANHLVADLTIDAKPSITQTSALSLATQEVGDSSLTAEKVDLVYLQWEGVTHLTWRILFPQQQLPLARYQVWVDAHSGEILITENRIESFSRPQANSSKTLAKVFVPKNLPKLFSLNALWSDASRSSPATGEGKGLDGELKTFQTTQQDNGTYLLYSRQGSKPTLSYSTSNYNYNTGEIGLFQDEDNLWEDPSAVDAYTKSIITMDFYRELGALNTWYPNSGFTAGINSVVHIRNFDTGLDNAFWDGQIMGYGDGDVFFRPLAGSLDVVSHELTHGMTEATTNLIYCNEPGALNESWSDVMAMLLSLKRGDTKPYLLAESIMKIKKTNQAYYALRRMDDPAFRSDSYPENDYSLKRLQKGNRVWGQPAHVHEQYQVRRCTLDNDLGGVHINSGIVNRAAYLISKSLGDKKTSRIYYQALFYLSSTASFKDARAALKQAATDLYGADSEAVEQIELAYDTVGIK
ncbi:M4 family metallopeptidase [uncultured Thiothrix sp.]|uniref:M4 family metallopeptidase n=1 Tax=uncultured Thiothrix sp. TaxID=223185 RepID=UPI002632C61A|nr:M4 family metallopeptidase [uncultured Thiothrix sp.]